MVYLPSGVLMSIMPLCEMEILLTLNSKGYLGPFEEGAKNRIGAADSLKETARVYR